MNTNRADRRIGAVTVLWGAAMAATLLGADGVVDKAPIKINPVPFVSVRTGVSKPLREMTLPRPKSGVAKEGREREIERERPSGARATSGPRMHDPVVQKRAGAGMPSPIQNFEGMPVSTQWSPPDTTMAVGPNDVGQWINSTFEIFDKTGNSRTGGPVAGNALWTGFGGDCETDYGQFDPIVLYDQLADRWVWSKIGHPGGVPPTPGQPTESQCFALSATGDPLGAYYQYQFVYSGIDDTGLNDFPKIGVWPDAYYMTVHGVTVTAYDRTAMLAGLPALGILINVGNPDPLGLLPAGQYGLLPPGAGGSATPPNILMGIGHPDLDGSATPRVHIYYFHPDFVNPESSSFTGPVDIEVDDFDPVPETYYGEPVPQPPPGGGLIARGNPQYQLPYRNFGDHESLVLMHDVHTDGVHIGPRWYEIRDPFGSPFVYQQGTYGPADGLWRWMGSASIDGNNDIAMGYSVVNDTDTYPGIRWAGRLAGDPLGELAQGEAEIVAGDNPWGSDPKALNGWGDYSTMTVDPVDECTFWYTTEYTPASAGGDYSTRIGSFKFPSCTTGPRGTLEGTVTDGVNPLAGVRVTAGTLTRLTDAAGHYNVALPPDTYEMTASKYGYFSRAASGVAVTNGGDTVQNFVLSAAPSVLVNGIVKDESGGWPLYARVVATAPGAANFTTFTDPVTGYYGFTLVEGLTYNLVVTAVSAGYGPGGGVVSLAAATPAAIVKNFQLIADVVACSAPGYILSGGLAENFNLGGLPAGWSVTNANADGGEPWSVLNGGDPCLFMFVGNSTGGEGGYAIQHRNCGSLGLVSEDTALITPAVDLSGVSSAIIRFNSDFYCCSTDETADLDITTNGGSTWSNVFHRTSIALGPRVEQVDITSLAAGHSDVKARFHYTSAPSPNWWMVDNVFLGHPSCSLGSGGLIVGHVREANSGAALNGATVKNLPNALSTTTFATPDDPNQDDGLYILFAESSTQPFRASDDSYAPQDRSTIVIPNSTVRLDFGLVSGRLDANPRPLSSRVNPGEMDSQILSMTNTGTASASFQIHAGVPGTILESFPVPPTPYGVMFNTDANDLWISNFGPPDGDNLDHRFLTDGTETADTIDVSAIGPVPADGAYNPNTGMLWQVFYVYPGVDCVYELDPVAKTATGNKICPAFATGQAALAYDPTSDTFYSGSVDDNVLYHFDSSGTILDLKQVVTGAVVAGLAFNPVTGHLFVSQLGAAVPDVLVVDPKNDYSIIGGFYLPGALGMDMDCYGHLWLASQAGDVPSVFELDSGEASACDTTDIPWLSEAPSSGNVLANSTLPVTVTFNSTGLTPGLRQTQLNFTTNTPYALDPVLVDFTVRFLDVADSNQFEAYIYGAAGAGIMPGCGGNNFCPTGVVTRADMAGFIERAVHGPAFLPPAYSGAFGDVALGDYNAGYIQGLVDDGITAGCGGGNFCPNSPNTRAQMSVFILKAAHGSSYTPPSCNGIFGDVACPSMFADWIEALFNEGVTAGCGGGNYCPTADITNGQMAVFLVKAFNLPHL